jgi:hypothetical protein
MELYFWKKKCILKKIYIFEGLYFYGVLYFPIFLLLYFYVSPFHAFVGPKNVVGPRHSACSA